MNMYVDVARECISTYKLMKLYIEDHTNAWIKTHDSESQGQEAGRTSRMSELFTGITALKLVNALKPPLKLSLS